MQLMQGTLKSADSRAMPACCISASRPAAMDLRPTINSRWICVSAVQGRIWASRDADPATDEKERGDLAPDAIITVLLYITTAIGALSWFFSVRR